MARVSKTSPFPARRPAESRSNNEGQGEREEESKPEEDEESSISSEEEKRQDEEKKRKGKAFMKKAAKRGRGRGRPIKGVAIGLASKIPETGIGRGRKTARKTTFVVKSALYDLQVSEQEVATNGDPKGKGKEKIQETDEFEEDEACKKITSYERNKDDDRDKDYDGAHFHARFNDVRI